MASTVPTWLADQMGHSDREDSTIYGKWIAGERPDHKTEKVEKAKDEDPKFLYNSFIIPNVIPNVIPKK
ncbi:MAG: hypothetical protein ACJASB_001352 [Shewanella psychromarinicola]|jgi:hypothetical protein